MDSGTCLYRRTLEMQNILDTRLYYYYYYILHASRDLREFLEAFREFFTSFLYEFLKN